MTSADSSADLDNAQLSPPALEHAELVRRAQLGSAAAFEQIVLTFGPAVFAGAVDGVAFSEDEVAAIVERTRAELGEGPTRPRSRRDLLALMPYTTLAAAFPLAFILRRRNF